MNILKIIFVFFLILISIFLMICAFIPGKWVINEEIIVHKPVAIVSFEISKTQPTYFQDALKSISIPAIAKPDGSEGKAVKWKHSLEKGNFNIIDAEKNKVSFEMDFYAPYQSSGKGTYTLTDLGDSCRILMAFSGSTPFLFRINNLFIDRHYQPFFSEHIKSLKRHIEQQQNLPEPEVRTFMGITFKGFRKLMNQDSLDFFREGIRADLMRFKLLMDENLDEPLSSLIFSDAVDPVTSDRFYGLVSKGSLISPVPNDTSNMGITEIFIYDRYVESYLNGSHEGLKRAHRNMQEWFIINDLRYKQPVMETYIQGSYNQKDTAKWLTRIVYSF